MKCSNEGTAVQRRGQQSGPWSWVCGGEQAAARPRVREHFREQFFKVWRCVAMEALESEQDGFQEVCGGWGVRAARKGVDVGDGE